MLFYLYIYKTSESIANYNLSEYLDVKFQQWTTILDNNIDILENEYNMRNCKQEDFGNDANSIIKFKQNINSFYLVLCPDI
jgi:hypothetical protein